jgi:hypothetical protein
MRLREHHDRGYTVRLECVVVAGEHPRAHRFAGVGKQFFKSGAVV